MAFDIEAEFRSRGFKRNKLGFYRRSHRRGGGKYYYEVDCQGPDEKGRETLLVFLFDYGNDVEPEEVPLFNGVIRNKQELDLLFEMLLLDE